MLLKGLILCGISKVAAPHRKGQQDEDALRQHGEQLNAGSLPSKHFSLRWTFPKQHTLSPPCPDNRLSLQSLKYHKADLLSELFRVY